jgi:hypothetical protein
MREPDALRQDKPTSCCISGTLAAIIDDGTGDRPFRALLALRGGERMVLSSREPISCKPGDDLYLAGVMLPPAAPGLAGEFLLGAGPGVQDRVEQILEDGAEIRAFGPAAGERPSLAALAGLMKRVGKSFTLVSDGPDCAVLRPSASVDDPDISWALDLCRDAARDRPVLVIDPAAFTIRSYESRPEPFYREVQEAEVTERLAGSFPAALKHRADADLAAQLLDARAASFNSREATILVPVSAYCATDVTWRNKSGLPMDIFAPRRPLDPTAVRRFAAAVHLSIPFEPALLGAGADMHQRRCFGAAFATLALWTSHPDALALEDLERMGYARRLSGEPEFAVGPAIRAARELARRGGPTNVADIAEAAARIAAEMALSRSEQKTLASARDDFYLAKGAMRPPEYSFDPPKGTPIHARLWPLVSGASTGELGVAGPWIAEAVEAVRAGCHVPEDILENPGLQRQIFDAYKADVLCHIEYHGWARDSVHNVLDSEWLVNLGGGENGPPVTRILAAGRQAVLEGFREDRRIVDPPRVPRHQLRPGMAVLPAAPPPDTLLRALRLEPAERLSRWRALLAGEAAAMRDKDYAKAGTLAGARHEIAFALAAEARAWAHVESVSNPALVHYIAREAGSPTPKHGPEGADKSLWFIERQLAEIKAGKLESRQTPDLRIVR